MSRYGYEGQVGCAALSFKLGSPEDVSELEQFLVNAGLPSYGVPRFLRVLVDDSTDLGNEGKDVVGSERVSLIMKKLKTGLRKDGIETPPGSQDRMYWLEREGRGYTELSEESKRGILSGKANI